ncbi:3-dehydroquinate synthase [Melghirimyces algeriensis]|uniref:3-dehydroquinate synthase n=1 Tax=Melghirimyces algeriensis TaxID=910412 RepID=A0A521B6C8_9BACL|nr:3-dehydroquinate synthase [Melghirimyces algeriensis]SMO42649.1 3-dehydroquinate synthase [Melghirimyces algeriensis]
MKTLMVQTKERTYPIHIGSGLLRQLPDLIEEAGWSSEQSLMLVTDDQVAPLYQEPVYRSLTDHGYHVECVTIPAGEASKTLLYWEELLTKCIRAGLDRTSGILALGGGVVGDLAGFLAATYMRGIPFIQLPTTLLAHDSSVGGKVGVNHPLGKNMIGAFHQPSMVIFDVDTLHSLPAREVASGYAEVIKEALIYDPDFVSWLEANSSALMKLESSFVTEAILRGCSVKADVVSKDEKETGLRAILNYGHTIGHALEATAGYGTYTHGEAVAIGMVGAAMLGEELGLCPPLAGRTQKLLEAFNLPTRIRGKLSNEDLMERMRRDKKVKQGVYTFVLPRNVGHVELIHGVEEKRILKVLKCLRGEGR